MAEAADAAHNHEVTEVAASSEAAATEAAEATPAENTVAATAEVCV